MVVGFVRTEVTESVRCDMSSDDTIRPFPISNPYGLIAENIHEPDHAYVIDSNEIADCHHGSSMQYR